MLLIKPLQINEFSQLIDALKEQNWYLDRVYLKALYETFSNDFFIAKKDEHTVGFISALPYSTKFGFISNFIILREFQSLGYGTFLFSFALQHLKGLQIALDVKQNTNFLYEKYGFKTYYDVTTYIYKVQKDVTKTKELQTPFIEKDFLLFNENINEQKYTQTILQIIKKSTSKYNAQYKDGVLVSYGLSSPYHDGYKMSIVAQQNEDALSLFQSLIASLSVNTKIYIEATPLNASVLYVVNELKMEVCFKMKRMYNKVLKI